MLDGEEKHDCLASTSESPDLTSLGFFFGSSEAQFMGTRYGVGGQL